MKSFIAELKRRNIVRAALLYIGAAWALAQGAAQLMPVFDVSNGVVRALVVAAVVGFPLWLVFAWFYELTPQGLKRDGEVPADAAASRRTARKLDLAIIGVLLVAVVLLLTDRFVGRHDAGAAPDKSIAVLPLTNEGQADQQYFSDGLSEDLITALSQLAGLKVIARSSSFQFRDSKDDVRTIGAKLGVATLLEGSVRHAGDIVRVSAQLIDVADSRTLWSQRYDRPYKDLFALQDELAQAVAAALQYRLDPNGSSAQDERPPGGSVDAKNAYLEGTYYFDRGTEADVRKAIERFGTAIGIDPNYALAHASSGYAWTMLGARFLSSEEAKAAYEKARKALDSALAMAPNLAAAHAGKANLMVNADLDWRGAEIEIRRALEIAPSYSSAQIVAAVNVASLGQVERAFTMQRKALTTNPLRADGYQFLSKVLRGLGRIDDAKAAVQRAVELQSEAPRNRSELVSVEVQRGDAAAAHAAADAIAPGNWHDQALALALQVGPDRAAADAGLQQFIEKDGNGMSYQIAQIYAVRREADKTFEWLERAWAERDPGLQYLLYDPFVLRFRSDGRFAEFCKKVGLPSTTDAKAMP